MEMVKDWWCFQKWFLRSLLKVFSSGDSWLGTWEDGSHEASIHDVAASAGFSSVKIGHRSLFLLNYLSHTYGFEFPLPIWPLCASHQRWKQLFCHSSSQWLAPKLGKKVFLPKRSEKDLFLPFPNIYLKLIHVHSCYLLPCMNIMAASRCLILYLTVFLLEKM